MDDVNPAYIPRNHLVEEALAAATDGDLVPLERLWEAVTAPYDERPGLERYAQPAPPDFGQYRTFLRHLPPAHPADYEFLFRVEDPPA